MENTIIRVTKAQKLTAIRNMIPEGSTITFPGNPDTGKLPYEFNYNEIMAFIDNELQLLTKKNSGDKKLTADQKKNEQFKEDIINFLAALPEDSLGVTCTEMFKKIPSMNDFSSQKVAALCRQLRDAGRVVSKDHKGKTLFSLA